MNKYDLITYEDLTEDLQELSQIVGMSKVREIIEYMPGYSIYISGMSYYKTTVLRYMEANPDKTDKDTAKFFGVNIVSIRKWKKEQK